MRSSLTQRRKEFNDAIKNLSLFERFFAGVFFVIALILPLPGTGPASILLITIYVNYRKPNGI